MRNNWTRDELILAFNLYCKLPYGKFNSTNIDVKKLAEIIGRTPGAVAYKLVNFVSIDPKQKLLGRKGATNIGKLDKEVFYEFMNNFDNMFVESENILAKKLGITTSLAININVDDNKKGEWQIRESKVRKNQNYFRDIVLSNYSNSCAITGIEIPDLLIASHIKPWSQDEHNRLNPANGICLSATFDKAFDRGLITIDLDFNVVFSSKLKSYSDKLFFDGEFKRFENKKINLPIKFLPSDEFLEYHRKAIFLKE